MSNVYRDIFKYIYTRLTCSLRNNAAKGMWCEPPLQTEPEEPTTKFNAK